MATYTQQMQRLFHKFQKEVGNSPTDLAEIADWAIRNGHWQPQPADIRKRFKHDMADALRQEYKTDAEGRTYRVNHAVRETESGKQTSFWGDIDSAPRGHMEKAFQQRRRHIEGECYQLRQDVDHYNGRHSEEPQIQLILDFTDDVAEKMLANGLNVAA